MRKCLAAILIVVLSLSCSERESTHATSGSALEPLASAPNSTMPASAKQASTAPVETSGRLALSEAERLITARVRQENPNMSPDARFPVREMTTDAVWNRLGLQIFKVTDGVQQCEAFAIRRGRVFRIGIGFGGYGVTSFCVADPTGEGSPLLVFSFSCGSGIHRCMIGALDILEENSESLRSDLAYFEQGPNSELEVVSEDDRTVRILLNRQHLGWVDITGSKHSRRLRIRLRDDLPAQIRKAFRPAR